jgi:prevent-host-death family protein
MLELSIRDAKARFSEVVAAAARGERVIVTKRGAPFVELVPARKKGGIDFDRLAEIRQELGIEQVEDAWPEEFDDPAFSRAVLGLDD